MPAARALRLAGVTVLAVSAVLFAATAWQVVVGVATAARWQLPAVPWLAVAALGVGMALYTAAGGGAPTRRDQAATIVVLGCLLLAGLAGDPRAIGEPMGPYQTALLIGAAISLAAVPLGWLLARPGVLGALRRARLAGVAATELAALAGIVALFTVFAVRHMVIDATFSWDEAVYALTARHWVLGTPITGWALHRPPGMPVLGVVSVLVSEDETAFRVWGLIFAVAGVIAAWLLARSMGGPLAGLIAAAAIASLWRFQADAARFLTDIPATALLLLLTWWLWRSSRRERLPGTFLVAAPLAAAAFYVRYGAALGIAFLALTALIVWWRTYVRSWRVVVATAGLLLLLLLGHLLPAVRETGEPWGIAFGARDLAAPAYPGAALESYRDGLIDGRLAGLVASGLMVIGFVGLAASAAIAGLRRRAGPLLADLTLLVLPAVCVTLLLGWFVLPQVRYIFFPIAALASAGAVAVAWLVGRSGRWRGAASAVVLALVSVAILDQGLLSVGLGAIDAPRREDVRRAGEVVRTDAGGAPCGVLTHLPPLLTWYSGCASYGFGNPAVAGREVAVERYPRRYLVLYPGTPGGPLPVGADREAYLAAAEPEPLAMIRDVPSGDVEAIVYRLR